MGSRHGRRSHGEDSTHQETHQPGIQPPSHGRQRTQRVPCLRKSQGRSRETRVRKTTKRKGQNPQKNHGLQRQNDGSRLQTSLPVDGTRQRKGKSPHAQAERHHEENRRQKRQNGLRRIQQIDRRVEGQAKHPQRQTQVRHQGPTDKDASYILAGYNGLKQRALMLSGVGMGDAAMKKIQLIKRLTNQGYNLQVMAANGLKEFLASERAREEAERLEFERQQREKDRILRRIMDSNVRMMGVGFR